MDKLKLELTEEQIQRLLIYIGDVPYKYIADIIDDIKSQCNSSNK